MPGPARCANAVQCVDAATASGQLSSAAAQQVRRWLLDPAYEAYLPATLDHVERAAWQTLNEVFHSTLPFGTAGRRGPMYPIGTNAINERTIGETIQGLVDFLREEHGTTATLSCAVGYDTRINSRLFAELAAEIFAAADVTVYFLDGPRPTPELALTVRHLSCSCGVMISASHNPPEDNAVKLFWSNGGQILPFEADGVISAAAMVTDIQRELFDVAVQTGSIRLCQDEMDQVYIESVLRCRHDGPRGIRVLYTPLHGTGGSSVPTVLRQDGFQNVEVYEPHAVQDGTFPNVPEGVANPESPRVFEAPIASADDGIELILATDPDADRLGAAARTEPGGEFVPLTGNQIAVLLGEFLLRHRCQTDEIGPADYLVTTLVTTPMLRKIAESYSARTIDDVLTGFRWIGEVIDREGEENFVFAAEEAHGYLAGTHIRDKDGAVAAMLLAELASEVNARGRTLHQHLDELFEHYGCYQEQTVAVRMPGLQGLSRIAQIMASLRDDPPLELCDLNVTRVRDYGRRQQWFIGDPPIPLNGPQGELLIFDLELEGNYAAVRPSGTEPLIKFYLFGYESPGTAPLEEQKRQLAARLAKMAIDFRRRLSRD